MELKRNKLIHHNKILILILMPIFNFNFLLLFFSFSAFFTTTSTMILDSRPLLPAKVPHINLHHQEVIETKEVAEGRRGWFDDDKKIMLRRLMGGPGSSPPRCTSKCGKCTPCKPVRVRVPPGTLVTAEYYPEAWRCKCGNRLYKP